MHNITVSPWLWKYYFARFILNTQITCKETKKHSLKEIQQWNPTGRLSDTKDTRAITCKIQLLTAGLHPGWVCEGGVNDTFNTLSHSIIYENH